MISALRERDTADEKSWRWRALAVGLIVATALLHLIYLACNCPLDLAPDEAHYVDWSRQLDWSYYSKGPLVAYLIRLSVELAGPCSERLTGSTMLAVRLPAVLCGSLLLASLHVLTLQVFRREKLACAVVALALTLPIIAVGSSLMTIDAPYTCCWGWALVFGYQAGVRRAAWAWPAAGFLVGLGILAKYTMVLWLPSFALFLLTTPELRRLLFRPGYWIMTATAAACSLPILIWNAQHGWVTLMHNLGHAGFDMPGAPPAGIRWLGPLTFVAVQFLLLLGFWFVAWLAAMYEHRPWNESDRGVRYLWWMSAPMFVFFLVFGLKTGGGEPNWPVTAYISGMVLASAWLATQVIRNKEKGKRPTHFFLFPLFLLLGLCGACGLGVVLILLMHFATWAQPLLAAISGPPSDRHPLPLRRFDPTCRLRGWRFLAGEVDRVRAELRREGIEPLLAGSAWSLPGELAFYCADQPHVYSLGLALGDRWSQYDLWRPNPLRDPEHFAGRTIILIGTASPVLHEAFERVEPSRLITYEENGKPIVRWGVTICRGFKGFQKLTFQERF